MIYSFPSLWLGEDGRVERAGKRWKAMKSVPEWALGFALFQMTILLGDLQPSGRLSQYLLTGLQNLFLSCHLNSSEFIIHSFCAVNDKPLVKTS